MRWLNHKYLSIGLGITGLIILAGVTVWWPVHRAKHLIHQQLDLTGHSLSQIKLVLTGLDSLPRLSQVNSRQSGALKSYADQGKSVVSNLDTNFIQLKLPGLVNSVPLLTKNQLITDTNATIATVKSHSQYLNTAADLEAGRQLIIYQANIVGILTNILEYDPLIDTARFKLGSEDSQKRLELARSGLSQAAQNLQNNPKFGSDRTIDKVTRAINQLIAARDGLAKNGNTGTWIKQVNAAQRLIITNRTQFWATAYQTIYKKLTADSSDLTAIQALWQALADKYQLN